MANEFQESIVPNSLPTKDNQKVIATAENVVKDDLQDRKVVGSW